MSQQVRLVIHYPLVDQQRLVVRSSLDWERSIEPIEADEHGSSFIVELPDDAHHLYWKPCIIESGGELRWSTGPNYLTVLPRPRVDRVWPYFGPATGSLSERLTVANPDGPDYEVRVYLPPGYSENTLKEYPTLYMHDGQNVFLSEEAYLGGEWRADEMMHRLDEMAVIDKVIIVGVYPRDRMSEYSQRGYGAYGRFFIETLKPAIDARYRTLPGPEHAAVMGSSLGGVVSMHIAWSWPDVIGSAACLSSSFWYDNDLFERARTEPIPPIRLYLDSGWPSDNFSVTQEMATLLSARGMALGKQLMYFAFPLAQHSELHWAARLHLPFQFLFGKVWR
ncbi:MAG: putative alpha/beta superfamily hydrolase [Myxococcota bacterium]|jgi:predicted alpha/beta superfamily hydrolase